MTLAAPSRDACGPFGNGEPRRGYTGPQLIRWLMRRVARYQDRPGEPRPRVSFVTEHLDPEPTSKGTS
jgi:hypothetical protein